MFNDINHWPLLTYRTIGERRPSVYVLFIYITIGERHHSHVFLFNPACSASTWTGTFLLKFFTTRFTTLTRLTLAFYFFIYLFNPPRLTVSHGNRLLDSLRGFISSIYPGGECTWILRVIRVINGGRLDGHATVIYISTQWHRVYFSRKMRHNLGVCSWHTVC